METINTILFWAFLYVFLWNAWILLFNRGIPNIRTAPAIRKKIIERLNQDKTAKGVHTYTIIDMGSGNGTFARQIAAAMPGAKIIGLEVDKLALAKARFWQKKKPLNNLEFIEDDFFNHDLSKADALIIFQINSLMPRLRKKLSENVKPGTLVISNKFAIGGDWKPAEVLDIKTLYPHQKTIYIYKAE